MERIPKPVWLVAALVFVVLAVWSLTDENWSGVIVGVVLAVACAVAAQRSSVS